MIDRSVFQSVLLLVNNYVILLVKNGKLLVGSNVLTPGIYSILVSASGNRYYKANCVVKSFRFFADYCCCFI